MYEYQLTLRTPTCGSVQLWTMDHDEARSSTNRVSDNATECARLDPSEFIHQCLTDPEGKPIVQSKIHRELQHFLTDNRMSLVELPRDHGKTMQICGRVLWELGNKPYLRIKIVCSSEGVAAERGRFLQQAIANNERVRDVFPDLCSDQPWTATRFGVQRPANMIGPSVTAIGVGASLTGTRADLLVCDDIVDVKSLGSRAERQRIKNYFRDNLMNLLEPGGRCWCLFTPWHNDDLNNELKKNGAFQHFRRAIGENLEPIWPERWPRDRLQERRNEIGSASFARGYRLVPLADEDVPIRSDWIRFWETERPCDRVVLSIDPAVSAKAKADASALVVLGKIGNEIRCLEATARRVAAPELVQLIDQADRRWQPDAILFESNAAFAGIRDLLIRHASFGPKIKGIVQTKEKAARVAAFSVLVENGSFRLQAAGGLAANGVDAGQQNLFDEMTSFPCGEHVISWTRPRAGRSICCRRGSCGFGDVSDDAERRRRHSHAERGNERPSSSWRSAVRTLLCGGRSAARRLGQPRCASASSRFLPACQIKQLGVNHAIPHHHSIRVSTRSAQPVHRASRGPVRIV